MHDLDLARVRLGNVGRPAWRREPPSGTALENWNRTQPVQTQEQALRDYVNTIQANRARQGRSGTSALCPGITRTAKAIGGGGHNVKQGGGEQLSARRVHQGPSLGNRSREAPGRSGGKAPGNGDPMSKPIPSALKALRRSLRGATDDHLRDRLQTAIGRLERMYEVAKPAAVPDEDTGDIEQHASLSGRTTGYPSTKGKGQWARELQNLARSFPAMSFAKAQA